MMFEGMEVKVLLAGAGAGKTTRLIHYIKEELKFRLPEEIAYVTYTKKGVQEGLTRICNSTGFSVSSFPYCRTLHSLAFHALGLKKYNLFGLRSITQFNRLYGYNVRREGFGPDRLESKFSNMTIDTKCLEYYDLERSGALTTRIIAESDIDLSYYRSLVRDYEEFKADKCLVDFCDCLVRYAQEGVPLPCKVAFVDECQDLTRLQWKVVERAFANATTIHVAGDDKQCQPKGSLVLTKNGYKKIEDITQQDSLITFAQQDYCYYGFKQAEYHPKVARRPYSGKLIDVTVEGVTNSFTPDHRMLVRWDNRDLSLYCVYLMKKGERFRIGQCKLFSVNGATHLTIRMNQEGADEGWILRLCRTKEEALVWEQIYSFRYGIPQISWKMWYVQEMQDVVYGELGCIQLKATDLLAEVGRDIRYPMFTHEKAQKKRGGSCLSLCEAVNLIPEVMSVPVYRGKSHTQKDSLWCAFSVAQHSYEGFVYSMEVPKYHTYVTAGGLTVHNCIYKFQGACPDVLIDLSNKHTVERLDHSYRIPLSVYRLADAITCFIGEKSQQRLEPSEENGEGMVVRMSGTERIANLVEYDGESKSIGWYLLARNSCHLSRFSKVLEDNLIPYWTKDGFFMRGEILRRIETYMAYQRGTGDSAKRKEFMQKFSLSDFSKPFAETRLFDDKRKWVYWAYVEKYGVSKLKEFCRKNANIYVGTIHSVKGGEADNVAVVLDMSRRSYMGIYEDIDDELRCLYVAVTRAKKCLYLIDSKDGTGFDGIVDTLRSEFDLDF